MSFIAFLKDWAEKEFTGEKTAKLGQQIKKRYGHEDMIVRLVVFIFIVHFLYIYIRESVFDLPLLPLRCKLVLADAILRGEAFYTAAMTAVSTQFSGSYGCEREVLDPTDPLAEPGSAEEWSRYVEDISKTEDSMMHLGVPQVPQLSETPDLPLALRPEEPEFVELPTILDLDSFINPPMLDHGPSSPPSNEISDRPMTWSEIQESIRINSLQADAELQKLEDEYRQDLLAHGLPIESSSASSPSLQFEIDETEVLNELRKMKLESSEWTPNNNTNSNKKITETTPAPSEDKDVRRLVEIAAYHASPEYRTRNHDIYRQLAAPPSDDFKQTPKAKPQELDLDYDPLAGQKFMEAKVQEHNELTSKIQALQDYMSNLGKDLTKINVYLGNFGTYKQNILDEMEVESAKNQERIKEEFRRREEAEKARLARMEADRKEREYMIKEAQEKKKQEMIRMKEEAERKKREEEERKKHEQQERERQQKEAERLRKEQEEQQRREKEEAIRKAKEEEDARKKAEAEKQKAEEDRKKVADQKLSDTRRKSIDVQQARANAVQANAAAIEAEIETRAQRILGTMMYAAQAYDRVKSELRGHVGYRATYAGSLVRLAPKEIARELMSRKDILVMFNQYAMFRLNMEEVQLRCKVVKAVFNNGQVSNLKYTLAKKVTQAVGTKAGYLGAAGADLKILTQLRDDLEKQGANSVVAVDDFVLERQAKEGLTAPPMLFLSLYNFVKTILVKGFTEGPDKPGMMKSLAMICNAILGGRAKYWPAAPMTALVYMRFWEQAPSIFGAMGLPTDMGYKQLGGDGQLETSTDVNRRAEVAMSLFCHMGILRLANTKREQVLGPADILFALNANLAVPVYLRDELHYINVRTIMTIAPWELRAHVGYPGVVALEQKVTAFAAEETDKRLLAFAALLKGHMASLVSQRYVDQSQAFGCDEYKYWDEDDIKDVYAKRAAEGVSRHQMVVDVNTTNARIDREREEEERFRPSGDE